MRTPKSGVSTGRSRPPACFRITRIHLLAYLGNKGEPRGSDKLRQLYMSHSDCIICMAYRKVAAERARRLNLGKNLRHDQAETMYCQGRAHQVFRLGQIGANVANFLRTTDQRRSRRCCSTAGSDSSTKSSIALAAICAALRAAPLLRDHARAVAGESLLQQPADRLWDGESSSLSYASYSSASRAASSGFTDAKHDGSTPSVLWTAPLFRVNPY